MSPTTYNLTRTALITIVLGCILGFHLEKGYSQTATINLAGHWRFALDKNDLGLNEKWYTKTLPDKIKLPGILQAQGYGEEINTNTPWVSTLHDPYWYLRKEYAQYTSPGEVKVPFTSQPVRHYLGVAWYQTDFSIPKEWAGKYVRLFLERARWESRVWLDGKLIGTNNSLCAPHEFDLGFLSPGKHTLTIRLDNRMILPYRPDAHGVSDALGGTWNGIVGRIELQAFPPVWIDHIQTETAPDNKGLYAFIHLRHPTNTSLETATIKAEIFDPKSKKPIACAEKEVKFNTTKPFTTAILFIPISKQITPWDEFNPVLYDLALSIESPTGAHQVKQRVGFRFMDVKGNQIFLNNRPIFLRGTHHGGDFPLTGYPPTDVAYWKHIFSICKQWGLNHVRFHSYCPPEAAFTAADELGIYLQIEPGMWNEFNPGSVMEAHLYAETERILRAYGHHPSFVMFSASNEPKGRWRNVLPLWADHFRVLDPTRLYTAGTGFTEPDAPGPTELSDYIAVQRFGRNRVRGPGGWFGIDYNRSLSNVYQPVVVHELGQWCAYPSFDIIRKFTGYLRPSNYEIFRDSAKNAGLLSLAERFQMASGKFQVQCYKEDIEAVTRTIGLAGYQLLDLHDYLGQGTALVGVLDAFWEPRGYVTPREWRQFCNPIVPLAWITNRVLLTTNALHVRVGVAYYGPSPTTNLVIRWSLSETEKHPVRHGTFYAWNIRTGKETNLYTVTLPLSDLPAPAKYVFKTELYELKTPNHTRGELATTGKLVAENQWPIWVYPATTSTEIPPNVILTRDWKEAEENLLAGNRVIYVPPLSWHSWWNPPLDPIPIFWNRQMNPQWNRMLGLLCDKRHPALAQFPTEEYYEWQWSELVAHARAINIGKFKTRIHPIVAVIDDWNRNWPLAAIFEANVMNGRLLICTFDIIDRVQDRPAARQLRRSLLDYAASDKFKPRASLTLEELRSLWFDNLTMKHLGATVKPEEAEPVIDGNPNTAWLGNTTNAGQEPLPSLPHLEFKFTNAVQISGLIIMNRQNDRFRLGDIKDFIVEVSNDGEVWKEIARGTLASTFDPQTVRFPNPINALCLRFKPISMHVPHAKPAIAELSVIVHPPTLPTQTEPIKLQYRPSGYASPDIDEAPPPWQ